jgi:hypothetical protein
MKNVFLCLIVAAAFAAGSNSLALIASDNGGNYGGGWTNGANGGTGFLPWSISVNQNTDTNNPPTYFAGNFIGNPTNAGITGMASTSFGLYANPSSTNNPSVSADRGFSSAMSIGDTFSFQWAVNWDAGDGSKGFNLYSGGTGGTQLLNVNQGGFPGDIFLNYGSPNTSVNTSNSISYGTGPMTWSFTLQTATSLLISSSARDGTTTPVFSTNIAITGAPDAVRFYAANMTGGDQRQPYFNNLSVVPEPSTYALLAVSALALGGYAARRRARK